MTLRTLAIGLVLGGRSAQEEVPSERRLAEEAAAVGGALPEDLEKSLENRLRVLDVGAHPDDEDGALLHTFALQGAECFALYTTRGEGGQNAIGEEMGAALGDVREDETIAANRLLGASVRFLGFEDFGYSKRIEETFSRWGGREEVVRRFVRALRELRPHRVFTNHSQTTGHAHHQATSIALHEAVVAAADPSRFPEQLAEGLSPWQVDALFVRWFPPAPKPTVEGEPPPPPPLPPDPSVRFDYDLPSAGSERTIAAVAYDALLRHATQGPWRAFDPEAKHETHYVLTWSAHDARSVASLPPRRVELPPRDPGAPFTVDDLLALLASEPFRGSEAPSALARDRWLQALLGVDLFVPEEALAPARGALAAGDELTIFVLVHGRDPLYRGAACADAVRALAASVQVEGPATIVATRSLEELVADPSERAVWRDAFVTAVLLRVAPDAKPRSGLALRVELAREGTSVASLRVPVERPIRARTVASLDPSTLPIVRTRFAAARPASVGARATLRLEFPTGRVPALPLVVTAPDDFEFVSGDGGAPARRLSLRLDAAANRGSSAQPRFEIPLALRPTRVPPRSEDGAAQRVPLALPVDFADGAPLVTVAAGIAWIDALSPQDCRVALVPGADPSVGRALEALGVPLERIDPAQLEHVDLARFDTLVLDTRTLGGSAALRAQSQRLRERVEAGGHVVALYHKSAEWNPHAKEGLAPAPAKLELTNQRICEEDAPLSILVPGDPLFLRPNVILARDFDGWVQERALYVPHESYDPSYLELLSGSDRDEPPLRGTLLAWVGERGGSFTYVALALHRQLRDGHAGAHRLLANLVARRGPRR